MAIELMQGQPVGIGECMMDAAVVEHVRSHAIEPALTDERGLGFEPAIGPAELELAAPNGGDSGTPASTLKEAKEALERGILENALRDNNGNISKTAKVLGISRPTLYDLMSRYGL